MSRAEESSLDELLLGNDDSGVQREFSSDSLVETKSPTFMKKTSWQDTSPQQLHDSREEKQPIYVEKIASNEADAASSSSGEF